MKQTKIFVMAMMAVGLLAVLVRRISRIVNLKIEN